MTETEALALMGTFIAAYPASNADEHTIALWCRALSNADAQDAQMAATEWIRTSQFFPTIANINEIMTGYRRRREADRPALKAGGRVASLMEGRQAMLAGYLSECRVLGREPNPITVSRLERGTLPVGSPRTQAQKADQ